MTAPTSLIAFLEREITETEDLLRNLRTDHDPSVFESLEQAFMTKRRHLKEKLLVRADPDHEYLNHSDVRKELTQDCIDKYIRVAGCFQEARDMARLDRLRTADAIENLLFSLKNLRHVMLDLE